MVGRTSQVSGAERPWKGAPGARIAHLPEGEEEAHDFPQVGEEELDLLPVAGRAH